MVTATSSDLGVGVYSLAEAARLVGIHPSTVRRWLDQQGQRVARHQHSDENVVRFAELMELHFIKMFRDSGVSLPAIRKAAATAARRFRTAYPFAVKRFDTDGRTIFATLAKESDDEDLVEDLEKGQYVFTHVIRPFFKKLDYDRSEVARYWPLSKRGRIVLDPQRQFGRPIDAETGVPTAALYQALTAGGGQSVTEVARWFDIPEAAVQSAAEFERSLQ